MKQTIVHMWQTVMDSRYNPPRHLDLASQHYMMQVLGWMWSMIFSLSFLSIFHFGVVWLGHLLVIGGAAFTVAVFREAEKVQAAEVGRAPLSAGGRSVWQLDSEA